MIENHLQNIVDTEIWQTVRNISTLVRDREPYPCTGVFVRQGTARRWRQAFERLTVTVTAYIWPIPSGASPTTTPTNADPFHLHPYSFLHSAVTVSGYL